MRKIWILILILISLALCVYGQSERQRIVYKGFPGGLNSMVDPDECLPTQLRTAEDLDITTNGYIRPRNGIQTTGDGISSYTTLYWITNYGGTTEYFFKLKNTIYRKDISSSPAHISTVFTPYPAITLQDYSGSFVSFNGTTVYGDGINLPQYFVTPGTGSSTQNASDPPLDSLIVHNNRIFGANSRGSLPTLYETEVDSATNWASGAAWLISNADPSPITGLGALRGTLYIFTRSNIFRMTGYAPSERTIETFKQGEGTIFPESIKTVDLDGMGQCIIFVNSANVLNILTESGVNAISEYFQDTMDTLEPYAANAKWTIGYNPERKEVLLISAHKDGFSLDYKKVLLKMFGRTPYQTPKGLRWPIAKMNTSSSSYSFVSAAEDEILMASTGGYAESYEPRTDTGIDIVKYSLASAPESTLFSMTFRTRDEDAGDNRTLKGWKKISIITPSHNTLTAVTQINNLNTTVATGTMVGANAATEAYFNAYNWARNCSFSITTKNTISQVLIDYVMGAKEE